MTELEEFSKLLNAVYDAAMDESRWQDVALQIASAFDTHSCALQARAADGVAMLGLTSNVSPVLLKEYQDHYHTTDEWAIRAASKGLDNVYVSQALISDRDLSRSEHYEYLRRCDTYYAAGAVVSIAKDEIGVVAVHSGLGKPFDEERRRKMELLLPHVTRALKMRSLYARHSIQRNMALGALDRLPTPVALTDSSGKVVYTNDAAASILREADGLVVRDGRLSANAHTTTQTLLHFIREACSSESVITPLRTPRALLLPRLRRTPLSVLVSPIRADDLNAVRELPMAMLLIRDAEQSSQSRPEILQALFGLTRAEAWLASELANSTDPEEAAIRKGVSITTIRSQLQSIFRKTGTERQAELVSLIFKHTPDLD